VSKEASKTQTMRLKGVNLGGWLLMEGYILGGRNISESEFKNRFKKIYGEKELKNFEKKFRENFIYEIDFKNIKSLGANCVRVPFSWRLLEKDSFIYDEGGFKYLKKVLNWAKIYNLGVILDLHAAVGAQNCDWHSDSFGKALLWKNKNFQKRTFRLWEEIVGRFKEEENLVGYDLLNEPVLKEEEILKKFYQQLIKIIKEIDKKHTIFLEGNLWAQKIEFLKDLIEENISISIHIYQPLNYTFNFVPFYRFPGKIDNVFWNKDRIYKYLEPYFKFSSKNKVKIFVGEFGINWRKNFFGELDYLESILNTFEEFGFDYTYWTYKSVANHIYPDGIYQYLPNASYIKREGPISGWETYLSLWKKEKEKIIKFWRTESFTPNKGIINLLKKFFKQ
jgi:aryl-phospho-beta-D-glucosidase BglC (GH1 family)